MTVVTILMVVTEARVVAVGTEIKIVKVEEASVVVVEKVVRVVKL